MQRNQSPTLMSRQIQDDELHGAVVLVDCLFSLKDAIDDLKTFIGHAVEHQLQIFKAFYDLYLELTDETERRRFLDRRYLQMEREAARLRLPLWFWRPEPGVSLQDQVRWRAEHLIHRRKAQPDDVWDLLQEFIRDYVQSEMTDDEVAGIVRAAKGGEATNANA